MPLSLGPHSDQRRPLRARHRTAARHFVFQTLFECNARTPKLIFFDQTIEYMPTTRLASAPAFSEPGRVIAGNSEGSRQAEVSLMR